MAHEDPPSERQKELTLLRREIDHAQQDRMERMEIKLDNLDSWVREELSRLEHRIERQWAKEEPVLIDRAAIKAVKQAFSHLGVDVDNPSDLQRFRDDLRFGGVFRSAATKSFFALLAALFGGIGLSFWMAFKDKLGLK